MREIYLKSTLKQIHEIARIDQNLDKLERAVLRLSVLFQVNTEEIYKRNVSDIMKLDAELERIEKETLTGKQDKKIKVGEKWFFIDYTITNLEAGQFIDLQHFASIEPHLNMHKVIACVVRPMKHRWAKPDKYNGTKHEEISMHLLNHMTLEQAAPIAVFFCKVLRESLPDIQTYSQNVAENLRLSLTNL